MQNIGARMEIITCDNDWYRRNDIANGIYVNCTQYK